NRCGGDKTRPVQATPSRGRVDRPPDKTDRFRIHWRDDAIPLRTAPPCQRSGGTVPAWSSRQLRRWCRDSQPRSRGREIRSPPRSADRHQSTCVGGRVFFLWTMRYLQSWKSDRETVPHPAIYVLLYSNENNTVIKTDAMA